MKILLTLLMLITVSKPLQASENRVYSQSPAVQEINLINQAWFWIINQQRSLNHKITDLTSQLKDSPNSKILFYSLFCAFLYGILHALGPGHGKIIIISYFSSRKSKLWQALTMGLQIAFTHVATAIILVLLTEQIAKNMISLFKPSLEFTIIKMISYSLIVLVGLGMLGQNIYKHNNQTAFLKKSERFLPLTVGLIPCTGSLLILLFTLSHNLLPLGILLVSALAAGTAVTLSIIGLLCIKGFDLLTKTTKLEQKTGFTKTLNYISSSAIIIIGLLMLWLTILKR